MRDEKCRCCGKSPLVGYRGLCVECTDAVARFILQRRLNLKARWLAR